MGLSRITAMEIKYAFPEELLKIDTASNDNKIAVWLYRLKHDKTIHKILLSTEYVFNNIDEATKYMQDIIDWCVNNDEL